MCMCSKDFTSFLCFLKRGKEAGLPPATQCPLIWLHANKEGSNQSHSLPSFPVFLPGCPVTLVTQWHTQPLSIQVHQRSRPQEICLKFLKGNRFISWWALIRTVVICQVHNGLSVMGFFLLVNCDWSPTSSLSFCFLFFWEGDSVSGWRQLGIASKA